MAEPRLSRAEANLLEEELARLAAALAPITVRGLYYQAVISALLDFITKDKEGGRTYYRMVQGRVLSLRRSGLIAWDDVVDESRPDYSFDRWTSPAGFAETAPLYYRLDTWADQPIRPLVMVEKAGQVPVYRRHADRFGIDVAACKGYSSASHLRGVAEGIADWIHGQGQQVQVLVCADFDPSGNDWPRAAEVEIRDHLRRSGGPVMADLGLLPFRRVLVTPADLEQLGSAVAFRAPNPKDTRTGSFLDQYGFTADQEVCVEMDAISPADARDRLELIYRELYQGDLDKSTERQQEHRQTITEALASLA
jgi:hypothetical protein